MTRTRTSLLTKTLPLALVSSLVGTVVWWTDWPNGVEPVPHHAGAATANPNSASIAKDAILWREAFAVSRHIGAIRARFGESTTHGIPIQYRWEVRPCDDTTWHSIARQAEQDSAEGAHPTARTWFVDADACELRLRVDRSTAGDPIVHDVRIYESARNILEGAVFIDEKSDKPMSVANGMTDGTYSSAWSGEPGARRWTVTVALQQPTDIDRVRLVIGADATTYPRQPTGRTYAIANAPRFYTVETSDDGEHFTPLFSSPRRSDGTVVPLRRRLFTLHLPRLVKEIRIVMEGATNQQGLPDPQAAPMIRELSAYAANDKRPVIAAPWFLAVNANPSRQTHNEPWGELGNDLYHAKFLQARFAPLLPQLERDDRIARALGQSGELVRAASSHSSGEAIELIEGDDPTLDTDLIAMSSPPPLTILSGSNQWDYAAITAPDPKEPRKWTWNPLRPAREGGMLQIERIVKERLAPMIGLCGGAQILALFEAKQAGATTPDQDARLIDAILRRTTGQPIRGFARPAMVDRAWPGESDPRTIIHFDPAEPLFRDIAGATDRARSSAFPESHADMIRFDAFGPDKPLRDLRVIATSAFCGKSVVVSEVDPPEGEVGPCARVSEAFISSTSHSRGKFPIIGTQFHPEQRDFVTAAAGEPAESVADPRLFLAAAYELACDGYLAGIKPIPTHASE